MADLSRTKPPFRADHVGSLLRPAALAEARRAVEARYTDTGIADLSVKVYREGLAGAR